MSDDSELGCVAYQYTQAHIGARQDQTSIADIKHRLVGCDGVVQLKIIPGTTCVLIGMEVDISERDEKSMDDVSRYGCPSGEANC